MKKAVNSTISRRSLPAYIFAFASMLSLFLFVDHALAEPTFSIGAPASIGIGTGTGSGSGSGSGTAAIGAPTGLSNGGAKTVEPVDDTQIRIAVCQLLTLMQGSMGALLMTVAAIGAVVAAAFGAYRAGISMIVVALGSFTMHSMVSLWFGDYHCGLTAGSAGSVGITNRTLTAKDLDQLARRSAGSGGESLGDNLPASIPLQGISGRQLSTKRQLCHGDNLSGQPLADCVNCQMTGSSSSCNKLQKYLKASKFNKPGSLYQHIADECGHWGAPHFVECIERSDLNPLRGANLSVEKICELIGGEQPGSGGYQSCRIAISSSPYFSKAKLSKAEQACKAVFATGDDFNTCVINVSTQGTQVSLTEEQKRCATKAGLTPFGADRPYWEACSKCVTGKCQPEEYEAILKRRDAQARIKNPDGLKACISGLQQGDPCDLRQYS